MNMGSWYVSTLITELANGEYDSELCGNWGIAKYPHPEGAEEGATIGSLTGLAIPTSSENKDAAWDFIKFACGEEGAKIVAATGSFPALLNDETADVIASLQWLSTGRNQH